MCTTNSLLDMIAYTIQQLSATDDSYQHQTQRASREHLDEYIQSLTKKAKRKLQRTFINSGGRFLVCCHSSTMHAADFLLFKYHSKALNEWSLILVFLE